MELDEFLCLSFPLLSKRYLRRQVRAGRVLVDGESTPPSQRLRTDAVVSIDIDEEAGDPPRVRVEVPEVRVLFEDEHTLVVDKPADLTVEGDRWDPTRPSLVGAVTEMVLARSGSPSSPPEAEPGAAPGGSQEVDGRFRPRLVHRLDKDTSGAVLFAKTLDAERHLRAAFDEHRVTKTYLALVEGEHPAGDEGEWIELPIGPDKRKSGAMVVRDDGKPSSTHVRVEQRFRGFTLLECRPRTGRTHQIRVHLAACGFPLVVDPIYGRRKALVLSEIKAGYRPKPGRAEPALIERLTLHALAIEFPALDGSGDVRVEAPLPRDFERALKQMAKVRPPRRSTRR